VLEVEFFPLLVCIRRYCLIPSVTTMAGIQKIFYKNAGAMILFSYEINDCNFGNKISSVEIISGYESYTSADDWKFDTFDALTGIEVKFHSRKESELSPNRYTRLHTRRILFSIVMRYENNCLGGEH
jgi:hypothetical protein